MKTPNTKTPVSDKTAAVSADATKKLVAMKKAADKKKADKKAIQPAAVSPSGELTDIQKKFADELATKCPHVVQAVKDVNNAESELKGKYVGLTDALRTPVENMQLNAREMTLLLLSQDIRKQRVTELVRVATMPDEQYAAFKNGVLSFKATLQIARHGLPDTSKVAGATKDPDAAREKAAPLPKDEHLMGQTRIDMCDFIVKHKAEFSPLKVGEYVCEYEVPMKGCNRRFKVIIRTDDDMVAELDLK